MQDLLVAAGLFVLLMVGLEVGFRAGRRAVNDPEATGGGGGQIGAIQGAIIGLLGLLLAFSFAAAGSRFLERQDQIVQEANAIGTATLRADLLGEPYRSDLRAALRDYTAHRIDVAKRLRGGFSLEDAAEVDRLQARIWSAARAGVAQRPESMLGVLTPVNELIDVHSIRAAAVLKRLPLPVLGLLLVSSLVSVAVIGYGCGMSGRRRALLTDSLTFLIGAALWMTYDLDNPRAGLMQLSDAPLRALKFDQP